MQDQDFEKFDDESLRPQPETEAGQEDADMVDMNEPEASVPGQEPAFYERLDNIQEELQGDSRPTEPSQQPDGTVSSQDFDAEYQGKEEDETDPQAQP